MADNEQTVTMVFKVNDQGSVVIDNIKGRMGGMGDSVNKMNKSLSLIKWDSVVNLGERVFHTAEQIYDFARTTASAINDIDRLSKVAGMSAEQFQKMQYAAKMMDVNSEDLAVGMKKLSVNMDEASRGAGDAAKWFEAMGVSVKDTSGGLKPLDKIMTEIADNFSKWEDGPKKIAIAVDLFGRSGEKLIPFLNKGSAGMKEFYQEAEKLGIVLDEKLIKKGSELEDKFKKSMAAWDAFKMKIVVGTYEVIEALDKLSEKQISAGARGFGFGDKGKRAIGLAEEQSAAMRAAENIPGALIAPPPGLDESKWAGFIATLKKKSVGQLQDEKNIREVNLQLLKDQEATLRRITELQDRLNRAGDEAIDIAERLGISTKAALTQWIEKDIVGEYEKLLGSKLFSEGEMAQFRETYISALESTQRGGWGEDIKAVRQMDEAIERIKTMKVEDTGIAKVRDEFEKLTKYAEYLDKFTGKIKLDDSQLEDAMVQIDELKRKLIEMVTQDWRINVSIYGYGSSGLPIMEKIDQISNAFETMGSDVGNMVLQMNLSQIWAQMDQLSRDAFEVMRSPAGGSGNWNWDYMEKMKEQSLTSKVSQLSSLNEMYNQLSGMNYGGDGGGGYGGGGGGGVSINIGSITLIGSMDDEVGEKLDEYFARIWVQDRSKFKRVIGQ